MTKYNNSIEQSAVSQRAKLMLDKTYLCNQNLR